MWLTICGGDGGGGHSGVDGGCGWNIKAGAVKTCEPAIAADQSTYIQRTEEDPL